MINSIRKPQATNQKSNFKYGRNAAALQKNHSKYVFMKLNKKHYKEQENACKKDLQMQPL